MNDQIYLISNFVHVKQSGFRSVHLEMDLLDKSINDGYVITNQARSCFARILNGLDRKPPTRSWTLTGPYGSGKSYFSLFIMNILSTTQRAHRSVFDRLSIIDPVLAAQAIDSLNHGSTKGLLPIPITGYRASIQTCIRHGLKLSLERLHGDGNIQPFISELETWSDETSSRVVVDWISRFIGVITQPDFGYSGIVIVFDELGKALEYTAAHIDVSDLYLLQELAELSTRSGDKPFIFIGILHQAFERYATFLDLKTQQEWSKIQNRFEDIVFSEPPAHQIRLLSNVIEYENSIILNEVLVRLSDSMRAIIESNWCPPLMEEKELEELSVRTYPFHPTTLVAIPYVFRRLAQNERSIFAYLASYEPEGFQEFIQNHTVGSFIELHNIFDYLAQNFHGKLFSTKARPITEAIARLESIPNLNPVQVQIIKTISIMNWLAESSNIKATESNLILALIKDELTEDEIRKYIKQLIDSNVVVYRKFNQTYSIWQGSDVNLEERMLKAEQQLFGKFSLANAIQEFLPPRPLVCKKHSYITGTVRFFEVRYLDTTTIDQVDLSPSQNASGILFICLPFNMVDQDIFVKWSTSPEIADKKNIVVGVAANISRLKDLIFEVRCLDWVNKNTPELMGDIVAKRELRTRIFEITNLIKQYLDQTLDFSHLNDLNNCRWYYAGNQVNGEIQSLSHFLSTICDRIYYSSPIIWNEILNRRLLSSQGAAARRNLIEKLLTSSSEKDLGIIGYPPERSMYESVIKRSNLHYQGKDGSWVLEIPKNDPHNLTPSFEAISNIIFTSTPEIHRVEDIYTHLRLPPYGLTDGFLPVLFCLFMIQHKNEVTLYREGSLLPDPGIPDWEILLRRPELFSVSGCKVSGSLQSIINRFAKGYQVEPYAMPVVRALVRGINSLPDHSLKTNMLSQEARNVRNAILQARSPESLLFIELPKALELEPFSESAFQLEKVEDYFEGLNLAFNELATEMSHMIDNSRDVWLKACGLEPGEQGLIEYKNIVHLLIGQPTDARLFPLIDRAVKAESDHQMLESTLAYINNRPPRSWTDVDLERFNESAQSYGSLFQSESESVRGAVFLTEDQVKMKEVLLKDIMNIIKDRGIEDWEVVINALKTLLSRVK